MITPADREQFDRIEAGVNRLIEGLELKKQWDRVEARINLIPIGGLSVSEVEDRIKELHAMRDKLKGVSAGPKPSA